MSATTQSNVKKYFFEKDRLESFKSWPFSDKAKCSVKKVNNKCLCLNKVHRVNDSHRFISF